MKQLQENLGVRVAAWVLLVCAVFGAVYYGVRCLMLLPFVEAESVEYTTPYHQMLMERENSLLSYAQYSLALEQETSFMEQQRYQNLINQINQSMAAENTNFRFQVYTQDGKVVLYENLGETQRTLEDQVSQVYYAALTWNNGQIQLEQEDAAAGDLVVQEFHQDGEVSVAALEENAVVKYGVLSAEDMTAQDEFYHLSNQYQLGKMNFSFYLTICLILAAAAAGIFLFLMWASGHKPGTEGVVLTWQEHIFTEFYLAVAGTAVFLGDLYLVDQMLAVLNYGAYSDEQLVRLLPLIYGAALTGLTLLAALLVRTLVVRCKAKALGRTTLICRIVVWLWRCVSRFVANLSTTWKTALFFLGYLAIMFGVDHLWPLRYYYPIPGMVVNLAALMILCWWASGFWRVRKGAQVIAAGNLNHQIETAHLPADLKEHAEILNNISGGLTDAVNEQMKSERFKAELITNVSHDLKTPLTSIINYVNLLKSTQQTDPTAMEYIEVLDRKSQRLKKLTEDLVEASKASTGALTVNREKIGMGQLLSQALGEYEEKLESRHLTVVTTLPEGESYVFADGRHLWRVIDNLLSNCCKYAMEGTRIYMELVRGKGSVTLSVKNVSREALNIPAERLMERFVRGEESRTTEGSGLGLSIAKSLTELQGGTFELVVDGDLFKALVTLPQAS